MAYTLQEYYDVNDNTTTVCYGVQWRCQTFTDAGGFDLTRVSVKAFRTGTPGDVTMDIMGTTDGKPSEGVLGTVDVSANGWTTDSAGDWYNFDFSPAVTLTAGTPYAIVLSIPGGGPTNKIDWRDDSSGAAYDGGTYVYSTDSGSNWTISSGADLMFRTYSGDAAAYVDLAFTDTVTFSEVLNLGNTIPIGFTNTVTFSESVTISLGPLSGTKAEKDTRRLVAFGNDTAYYEDI